MAVNLTATARLNTGPFMAGLKTMQAGLGGLSAASASSAEAEKKAGSSRAAANKAAGASIIAQTRAMQQQEAATQRLATAQNRAAAAGNSMVQGLSAQRYLYGDMARMTSRAALGLTAIPLAAIAAGVSWEKDFANVVRTSDPDFSSSAASVENLRQSMVDMVQTMPASWGDVTEIATLANQMGIASNETSAFTRAVAMFSATSGVSVDQTATAFGRLKSIVPDVGSDFTGLADSILKVGVNSVATEGEIINIVTQISSIAGAAGMGSKDMIGLAGAMASVRVPPELSRGVITRTFGQISRATTNGGASLAGFAKIAGMTSDEFRQAWGPQGNTGEAFKSFVKGLQQLGPRAESELRGLGITSVRDVPVLLRLSMAADSEGNVGQLLEQTMSDANNAANETQRQYTIMSATVGAKLKVLGNNLMAFFSGISQSSLGPVGDILDFVSEKLANLTDSLDDSTSLFGAFDLPFTNGELIGWATTLSLAAAGMLALGSAVLKVKQGMIGAQQIGALLGGGGRSAKDGAANVNRVAGAYRALPAAVITSMGRAEAAAKRGFQSMNQQAIMTARIQRDMDYSMARAAGVSAVAAPVRPKSGQDKQWVAQRAAAAQYGVAAESAAARTAAAFGRAGGAVSSAAAGMGRAASFAFGPWGLAIGIASVAIAGFLETTRGASTQASELAESLTKFDTVGQGLKELSKVSVGGLFGYEAQPFKEGFKNLQTLQKEAAKLRETERYDTSNAGTARFAASGNLAKSMGDDGRIAREYAESVKTIDAAFQEMVNAGNGGQAATLVQKFAGSSKDLMGILDSPEGKNMGRFFDAAFEINGLERTRGNLDKLAKGSLPDVRAALLGIADATSVTSAELDAMEGGSEAFSAMASAAEETAASFIKYADAVKTATDEGGNFNMDSFSSTLQEQMNAQNQWAENLAAAGKFGGSEFVSALNAMGPESQMPLQAIVDNFNETGGDINGAWKGWMDQIIASTASGAATTATEIAASRDAMVAAIGDVSIVDELAKKTTPEQFSILSRGMQNVGQDMALSIAQGIQNGSYTIDQAMGMLTLENEVKINADFDITPAMLSIQALTALGNGTIVAMQLQALPDLAVNAIWQVVETADGATGFVQVDAESGAALEEVAYVVDTATGAVSVIPLTADDTAAIGKVSGVQATANGTTGTVKVNADVGSAIAAINSLSNRNTSSTHTINVVEVSAGGSRIATSHSGGITRADGGITEFYANGGIRRSGENHTAQIVPGGTYRTFAEAETEGEAYIPLARSKRTRSINILDQVASRFGMSLMDSSNAYRYADGGTYAAQSMSRSVRSSSAAAFAGGLSIQDREFFSHLFREVVVTADSQRITGLTNNINDKNARFAR